MVLYQAFPAALAAASSSYWFHKKRKIVNKEVDKCKTRQQNKELFAVWGKTYSVQEIRIGIA